MEFERTENKQNTELPLYAKGFLGVAFYLQVANPKAALLILQESILVFLCQQFSISITNTASKNALKQVLLGLEHPEDLLPYYLPDSRQTNIFAELYTQSDKLLHAEGITTDTRMQEVELLYNKTVENINKIDANSTLELIGDVDAFYRHQLSVAQAQIDHFEQKNNCTYEVYDKKVYGKESHSWEEEKETNAWLMALSDFEHYKKHLSNDGSGV